MNDAVLETTETAKSFDGTMLAFHTWTPENDDIAGPIALIHHGAAFHGAAYFRLGRLLASYGIPALAIDARGHGLSEGKRGDLERASTLLGDLSSVAMLWRERYPERPLIMIGESMGGLVALLHAYQAQGTSLRADALVLSAPGLTIHPHKIFNINTLSAVPRAFLRRGSTNFTRADAQENGAEQQAPTSDNSDQLALPGFSANYIMVVAGMSVHSPQAAAHIEIPTLILHGKKDDLVPYQGSVLLHYLLAAHDKEIELYPEDGHTLFWSEEGAPVFDRLLEWIARHFPIAA